MTDKNGIEIKTGDIVEITGAYFKNDNGLYYVENSPGNPSWCGSDHSLKKVSKKGKISTAKHNLCFWPIGIFVSDRFKAAEARRWNSEHAQIEIMERLTDMGEIAAYFQSKYDDLTKIIHRAVYDWGEDHPEVLRQKTIQEHYKTVIQHVEKKEKNEI